MPPRLQLNIRMDNEPELYEAIKVKAEQMNTTVTDLTIAALRQSLDWQIPADAIAMLKKINANESKIKKLESAIKVLKKKI